ncbi:MAG TPA: HEAT repeat domain-containing protein [Gemmatimonadaceae bacterium]|nr:HEAT repeat domain-containing protein [Gemmatimonadaceae bacterium]
MRSTPFVLPLLLAAGVAAAGGQTVGHRVAASDGVVQVIYPSRPGACGDGSGSIGNVLGRNQRYSGEDTWSGHGLWENRQCVRGPARVVATVLSGEVTRLRVYVGPIPATEATTRTLNVGATEAAAWLDELVARGGQRLGSQAMLPRVLADAEDPWPLFMRVARDANRPRDVRQSALAWLSSGVAYHLGIADSGASGAESDEDQMRAHAVFVLTQRPRGESVPALIDIARTASHAAARKAAIYWLGQSGDPRALDVYAELLGLR